VDQYGTEEEQVQALRRWWKENGTTTIMAIVVALASGFGWKTWTENQVLEQEQASDIYQAMLKASNPQPGQAREEGLALEMAEQLKSGFSSTAYAQYAALHLAAMAVREGQLPEAEAQLRWVLGKADKGSDNAQVAQLRLARVLAAGGDTDQALAIIADAQGGSYGASYAIAQGDILYTAGRDDEARAAYNQAMAIALTDGAGTNLPALQQKIQSLTPVAAVGSAEVPVEIVDTVEPEPMIGSEALAAPEPMTETEIDADEG
jgi:predicted negative regulator of RcsB-dependent stress response